MIILICLIILFFIGVYIEKKGDDYDLLGIAIYIIASLYIFVHLSLWGISKYEYNKFKIKGMVFVETLQEARKNNSPLELAAITKDIIKYNQDLAEMKYDNNIFLLKDYIDDRIESLESIK
jgi:hypothetical protein